MTSDQLVTAVAGAIATLVATLAGGLKIGEVRARREETRGTLAVREADELAKIRAEQEAKIKNLEAALNARQERDFLLLTERIASQEKFVALSNERIAAQDGLINANRIELHELRASGELARERISQLEKQVEWERAGRVILKHMIRTLLSCIEQGDEKGWRIMAEQLKQESHDFDSVRDLEHFILTGESFAERRLRHEGPPDAGERRIGG